MSSNPPDPRIAVLDEYLRIPLEFEAISPKRLLELLDAADLRCRWWYRQAILDVADRLDEVAKIQSAEAPNTISVSALLRIWAPTLADEALLVPGLTGGVTSGVGDERQTGEGVNPAAPDQPAKTTDASTGAVYYRLEGNAVARTVQVSDWLLIDVDSVGAPVGVEWLGARAHSTPVNPGALAAENENQAGVVPDPTPEPEIADLQRQVRFWRLSSQHWQTNYEQFSRLVSGVRAVTTDPETTGRDHFIEKGWDHHSTPTAGAARLPCVRSAGSAAHQRQVPPPRHRQRARVEHGPLPRWRSLASRPLPHESGGSAMTPKLEAVINLNIQELPAIKALIAELKADNAAKDDRIAGLVDALEAEHVAYVAVAGLAEANRRAAITAENLTTKGPTE